MAEKLECEWTPDCQGKWDYDADLVRVSSRYWPRCGGFMAMYRDDTGVRVEDNDARPEIRPSARASILLQEQPVAEASFEGDTEAEVKAQVEAWAQAQFERIAQAVRALYG